MKRANGTGSVVKLSGSRRKPYAVKVSETNKHGVLVQKILSYHEKAADAQQALDDYNMQFSSGHFSVDKLDTTLQDVYSGWSQRNYRKMGKSSVTSYTAAWNKRLSQYANRKFRQISLDDWQRLVDDAEDQGMSQSTINNLCILIRALNSYAMERDIISKDYSAFLDIPSVDIKNPRNSLSDLHLKKLENLASDGVPWADTALILCYTGFRVSEFLSLTRFSWHTENGGYLQGGLKSDAGKNRIVPVHPKIRPYLDHWLSKGGDTIICDDRGHPITSSHYRDLFSSLMVDIGAEGATPHWCRHTFATRLHAAHADPLVTKWLMGHSTSSDITAHYTHQTIHQLVEAVKLLA